MRIAYLVNQYPQPSHSFIRREIAALEALGHTVRRFTLRRFEGELRDPRDVVEREKTRVVLARGVNGLAIDTLRAVGGGLTRAAGQAWRSSRRMASRRYVHAIYLAEAAALKRMLDEVGAEHLHAHFGTNSAEVARLCRRLGGPPYSFTCHGPEEFDRPIALDLGGKVAESKFAVAISSFGRSQLWRWTPFDAWDRVEVVRCGVDGSFLEATEPPAVDAESRSFCCVGRLAEQKGQLVLVRAAALLREAGHAFRVDLLGEGPLRAEIEREVTARELGDVIRLHGLASGDEVRRAMLASRACVLPSFAEGLPVVLMESLALGRPCIATAVAGMPELADAGTGWLVPPGDEHALAEMMQACLASDAGRLRAMGAEGRRRVRERHDASREADRLSRLMAGRAERP